MVRGDFHRALSLSNSCAGELTVANQGSTVGTLHEEVSSVYQLSSVQIRAIIGDLIGAHKKWDDVRADFSSYEPGDLFNWEVILASTEGILYEKEAKPLLARTAYKKCLDTPYCSGRLAVMALEEKNYVEAAKWAEFGIKRNDPAAFAVFGDLSRAKGDFASAARAYEKADFLIKAGAESGSHLPVYFAEQARIKEGLKLTMDSGISSACR
jgi:hypothetical protein